jgi:hypothetical protein
LSIEQNLADALFAGGEESACRDLTDFLMKMTQNLEGKCYIKLLNSLGETTFFLMV